ncbi:hypothetical protein VTK56DRAFT_7102 [Thermocarpiscus australiensis]
MITTCSSTGRALYLYKSLNATFGPFFLTFLSASPHPSNKVLRNPFGWSGRLLSHASCASHSQLGGLEEVVEFVCGRYIGNQGRNYTLSVCDVEAQGATFTGSSYPPAQNLSRSWPSLNLFRSPVLLLNPSFTASRPSAVHC